MVVSSPSGRQATTINSGKKPPRGRPFWRRVGRIAAAVLTIVVGAIISFYIGALLSLEPIVVVAAVLILIALVIVGYFWGKKPAEVEEETIGPRLDELATTDQDIKQDTGKILEQGAVTHQQLTAIAERLNAEAPAIPATVRASSLPRPANLIGRDQTLGDLMVALRAGRSSSIIALEGMGGVGKTALGAEAVARLAGNDDFPGGAVWVSVAGLTGAAGLAEVWTRIAGELGLSQLATLTDPEARRGMLCGALAARAPTLLALDNAERDLDANALLDTLAIVGHTTLLLTSRYALAPQRLITIALRPLPAPDAEDLFRDQMRRRDASRPNAADEAHIATLAQLVGGLPLAVELVAAYASGQRLSLTMVLKELREQGLDAAAYDDPLYPQRALVATFEQSWAILAPLQRQLFAGLSLLAESSFPRAVGLALAAATEPPASASVLAALVSYALVEPLADERLRLHPLLREYAAQKLATLPAMTAASLGQAMMGYWIAFAEGHPGYEGMDALADENDGLMTVLTWAHDRQQHETLLALTHGLRQYWWVRGRRDDARLALPWAVAAAQALQNKVEEQSALHALAMLKAQTGDLTGAQEDFEQALLLARQFHDPAAERAELHELAELKRKLADVIGAQVGFEEVLALPRQLHDPAAEFAEPHGLALLKTQTGDVAGAQADYEEALALARQFHDPAAERAELHGLAVLKAQTGDVAGAQAGFEEALALARQLRDPAAIAAELRNLGVLLGQNGQPERGRAMIEESLSLSTQLGDPMAVGDCHQFLAWLDRDAGDRAGAIAHYREALRRFEQVRSPDAEDVRRDLRALVEDA